MFTFFSTAVGFVTTNWMRLVIYGLLIVGVLSAAAGWGYHRGVLKLYDYQAKQATAAVAVMVKQGKATEKVINHYIKVVGETKTKIEYRDREIITYVESNLDDVDLSNGAVSLLDSAAANTLPDPARTTDGTPSGVKVNRAVKITAENYAICNQNSDKVRGLQEFITEQQKANP